MTIKNDTEPPQDVSGGWRLRAMSAIFTEGRPAEAAVEFVIDPPIAYFSPEKARMLAEELLRCARVAEDIHRKAAQ